MGSKGALRVLAELIPVLALVGLTFATAYVVAVVAWRQRTTKASPQIVATTDAKPQQRMTAAAQSRPESAPVLEQTLAETALYSAQAAAERAERDHLRSKRLSLQQQCASSQAEVEQARERAAGVVRQSAELASRITKIEAEATAWKARSEQLRLQLDLEEREAQRARQKATDSYAVVPYRAANGTWRQPIVIDCRAGGAKVLPDGPEVRLSEADGIAPMRSHPLTAYVRRLALELEDRPTTDGAPSVAYLLFLVRPDGIKPFYEARALLEPTGIAFGYELVGQDWEIDAPESRSGPSVEHRTQPLADRHLSNSPGQGSAKPSEGEDLYVWPGIRGGDAPQQPLAVSGFSDQGLETKGTAPTGRGVDSSGEISLDSPYRTVPDPRRGTAGASSAGDPEMQGYVDVIPRSGRAGARPSAREASARTSGAEGGLVSPRPNSNAIAVQPQLAGGTRSNADQQPAQAGNGGHGSGGGQGSANDPLSQVSRPAAGPPPKVEWMDITVVCRPNEVDVEPGGYRITTTTLSSTKLLAERLAAIARSAESGNGEVARRPRLKFLIEPGGEATFLDARRQTTYSDFDWPTTLQVTEGTRVRNPLGLSGFES